jgi:flagellar export protein FliJ
MSKPLKALNKLLRFKKQTMDALRLQLAQKQQEIDLAMNIIDAQKITIQREQMQIHELLNGNISHTSFLQNAYATIQQQNHKIHVLQQEADEILSNIQREFSESKAYEAAKESILEKISESEKRKENETLDDIASRSAF